MSNRWAEYYRAEQRARLADAESFRLCPHYDGDEPARQARIATYEQLAANYGRMADESEE